MFGTKNLGRLMDVQWKYLIEYKTLVPIHTYGNGYCVQKLVLGPEIGWPMWFYLHDSFNGAAAECRPRL